MAGAWGLCQFPQINTHQIMLFYNEDSNCYKGRRRPFYKKREGSGWGCVLGTHWKPSRWAVISGPLNSALCTHTSVMGCYSGEMTFYPHHLFCAQWHLGPSPRCWFRSASVIVPGRVTWYKEIQSHRMSPEALIRAWRCRSEPFFICCFSVFSIVFHQNSELLV